MLQALTLTLVHRAGALGLATGLATPDLIFVVSGYAGEPSLFPNGAGTLACTQSESARMVPLFSAQLSALVASLAPLLPTPELECVPDSSDWGASVDVVGALDARPFAFSSSQLCSGYRGRHAEAFVAFLRALFALAELDIEASKWSHLVRVRS